jgi:hypothetical protein
MSQKKKPSTALAATSGTLPESIARRMLEWRRVFSGPPPVIFLQRLGQDVTMIETLDGKPLNPSVSYLAIETITNSLVGVIRDGTLHTRPDLLSSSRTRCTLFTAAKA